jgi:hypothetical protein
VKFEIKTGRPFEGDITVTVRMKRRGFSVKKAVVVVLVAAIFGVVIASIAYGVATGDYSFVRSIAESGKEMIVEIVAKVTTKPKE